MTLGTVQIDGMTYAVKTICEVPIPVPIPAPIEIETLRNVDSDGYQKLCEICDEYAAYHHINDISSWVCDQCRIDISNYSIEQAN